MTNKIKKILGLSLSIMTLLSAVPVYAEETQSITEAGQAQIEITVNVSSTFTVKLPTEIVLDNEGNYSEDCVLVTGNTAGNEYIEITIPETITMESSGKDSLTGTSALSQTRFFSNEISDTEVVSNLSINVDNMSAGSWESSMTVEIELKDRLATVTEVNDTATYLSQLTNAGLIAADNEIAMIAELSGDELSDTTDILIPVSSFSQNATEIIVISYDEEAGVWTDLGTKTINNGVITISTDTYGIYAFKIVATP